MLAAILLVPQDDPAELIERLAAPLFHQAEAAASMRAAVERLSWLDLGR